MGHNVLKHWDVMLGCDLHTLVPPPTGVPIEPVFPYFVIAPLKLAVWGALTGHSAPTVKSDGAETMQQNTDIGPLIPHIGAPNFLLPIYILTSASKSFFAASTVKAGGSPVAVAVDQGVNYNLNCGGYLGPPTPFGIVFAPSTVQAKFTAGDFFAGLLNMAIEFAVQYALNKLFASKGAGQFFDSLTSRLTNRLAPALIERLPGASMLTSALHDNMLMNLTVPRAFPNLFRYTAYTVGSLPNVLGALIAGSPLGTSASDFSPDPSIPRSVLSPIPKLTSAAEDFGDGLIKSIDDYYNQPSIEQHPIAAPGAR